MRTKADFVTNSSSTSFIIGTPFVVATDTTSGPSLEVKVKYDLGNLKYKTIRTIKDLDRLKEEWYIRNDEIYDKCVQALNNGKVLHVLRASTDGDDAVEYELCRNGFDNVIVPEHIEIIDGEGGY